MIDPRLTGVLLCLLITAGLSGCGQTGPLLLPTGDTNEQVDAVLNPAEETDSDEEEEN